MHRLLVVLLSVAVSSTVSWGDQFHLKSDKTGKVYGPFETKVGSTLTIGNSAFTVVRIDQASDTHEKRDGHENADSSAPDIVKKLETIVIPEIDFRQANIHDVVDFFQKASIHFDPGVDPKAQKGVNIILDIGHTGEKPAPLITFSARSVSLAEALKITTRVSGLKHVIDGSIVLVVDKDYVGALIARSYALPEPVLQAFDRLTGEGRDHTRLKAWLTNIGGVEFPEGSHLEYVPELQKVFLKVNAESHRNMSRFLQSMPQ
jgi:hypothetical protein